MQVTKWLELDVTDCYSEYIETYEYFEKYQMTVC